MKILILFFINQNLIINPGFENWIGDSIVGWKIAHPIALPVLKEEDTVYQGNFSVKIKRQISTTTLKEALVSDTVSITGGIYYYIGAYVWDNDPNVYARVQVNWYKNGSYLTYGLTPQSQDMNGWQLIWAQRLSPDTANQAIIKINIYPVDTLPRQGFYFCDYVFLSTTFEIKEESKIILTKNIKEWVKYKTFDVTGGKISFQKNKDGIYFIKKGQKIEKVIILD